MSTLAVAAQSIDREPGSPRSPTIKRRFDISTTKSLKERRATIEKHAPPSQPASINKIGDRALINRSKGSIVEMREFTKVKRRQLPPSLKVWGRFGAKWVRNKHNLWSRHKWDISEAVNVDDLKEWEQRFAEMHVASNYHKRQVLKTQHIIKDAINDWWRLLRHTDAGHLPKDEYIEMNLAIYKQLIAWSPEAEEDARAVAEADWETDTLGRPYMPYETFYNSMFDLADNWTETTVEDEYADFLHGLRMAVTGDNRCIEFKRRQQHIDNREANRAHAEHLHALRQKKGRIEAAPSKPLICDDSAEEHERKKRNRLSHLGHHHLCPCHGCKHPHSIIYFEEYPDLTKEEEEANDADGDEDLEAPAEHPLLILAGGPGQPGGRIKMKPRSLKALLAARHLKEEEALLIHQVYKLREVFVLRFIELDPCATGEVEAHLFLQVVLFALHLIGPIPQSILVMLDVWRKFHDSGNGKVNYKEFMEKFDCHVDLEDFLWSGIQFKFTEPLDYHHWCRCPSCCGHRENIKYTASDKIELEKSDGTDTKSILQKINIKNRTEDRIRRNLIVNTYNSMLTLDMRKLPLHKPDATDCDCARCMAEREHDRRSGMSTHREREDTPPIVDMNGDPKPRAALSLRQRVRPHWQSSLSNDTAARKALELGSREALSINKFLNKDSIGALMGMFDEYARINRIDELRVLLRKPLFLSVTADRVVLSLSLMHDLEQWREHALQSIRQMFFADANNLVNILDSMYPGGDGRASRHDLLQAAQRLDLPISVGIIDEVYHKMGLTEVDRIDYREFFERFKVTLTSKFNGAMSRDMRALLAPLLEALYVNREKLLKDYRVGDVQRKGVLSQRELLNRTINFFKMDREADHHTIVVFEKWISYEADEYNRVAYTEFLDKLKVVDVIGELVAE